MVGENKITQTNYEVIVSQLKSELSTDCAISNKYGIILASNIDTFAKGKVIPQKILDLISKRNSIAEELKLKKINSFALESEEYNYLFTFSEELILISKLNLSVDLSKFMPNIRVFAQKLSQKEQMSAVNVFSEFDFSKDISKIETSLKEEKINKEKYSIIKDLIKYISNS
ncbi:MAG: hypothetical protein GF353_05210 [Candidatus Lokiarchaeota archaeon]|nr:hypothetical protein [Candidatus Lokiarchaeota archaeon]